MSATDYLFPSSSWDGTVAWSGRTPPSVPDRTTFKPIGAFADPPYMDVTGDTPVTILAWCKGGIASVTLWCEETEVSLSSREVYTDSNGVSWECFRATLKASSFPAHIGPFDVYATIVPNDPTAQSRVISLRYYANVLGTAPATIKYVDSSYTASCDAPTGTFANREYALVPSAGTLKDVVSIVGSVSSSVRYCRLADVRGDVRTVTVGSIVGTIQPGDTFAFTSAFNDTSVNWAVGYVLAFNSSTSTMTYWTTGALTLDSAYQLMFQDGDTATATGNSTTVSLSSPASGDVLTGIVSGATTTLSGSPSANGVDDTAAGRGDTSGNPYKTIRYARTQISVAQSSDVGGGKVKCAASLYSWGGATENTAYTAAHRWFSVESAAGVSIDDVQIMCDGGSTSGIRTSKVRLANLTWRGGAIQSGFTSNHSLFVDSVKVRGMGRLVDRSYYYAGNWAEIFSVGVDVQGTQRGFGGKLIKGCVGSEIGEIGIHQPGAVVRSRVDVNTTGRRGGPHGDVVFMGAVASNMLIYGLRGKATGAQGLFPKGGGSNTMMDIAVIDTLCEGVWSFEDASYDHVLVHNSSVVTTAFRFIDNAAPYDRSVTNSEFGHNVFAVPHQYSNITNDASNTYDRNFFASSPLGTNAVTGSPGWDSSTFVPANDGNLRSASAPYTLLDVDGHVRSQSNASLGAIAASAEYANASPALSITSSPATYAHGSSNDITATATDAEDGDLTASVAWTSDIQAGTLATGGTLDSAVLDVGTHTLTATVTDSGGLSASATVQIVITASTGRLRVGRGVCIRGGMFVGNGISL